MPSKGALRRLGEWCARHFVIVIVACLVALDVLKRHDPAAGGYSSQIVLHDTKASLTSLNSQMSSTVGDLQKLPHVLAAQNPLSGTGSSAQSSKSRGQQNVGPLSSGGRTGYITVRVDVQPSTLGDSCLNGVDHAVPPLKSAGAQVEYGGPLGELGPVRRTKGRVGCARPVSRAVSSDICWSAI